MRQPCSLPAVLLGCVMLLGIVIPKANGFRQTPLNTAGMQVLSFHNTRNPLQSAPSLCSGRYSNSAVSLLPSTTLRRKATTQVATSAKDSDQPAAEDAKLDQVLTKLTSFFPFWVLSFALGGLFQPHLLQWVNQGQLITIMLASVMVGTGLTLTTNDFTNILFGSNVVSVPLGVACQFLIMPFTASLLGRSLLLGAAGGGSGAALSMTAAKSLFLGLILVGCSPGGTASNLVSLIAQADVALSVILTACSTILASAVTPLLVKFLVGSTIAVSGKALMVATARVVLLPVLLGMIFQSKAPNVSKQISRFTPFGSVLLIAFICGGVVAENAALLWSSKTLIPRLLSAVGLLHIFGFAMGYLVPRRIFGRSETTARTVSIETGMQNSALAVVLARSMGADPLASLPGAISATAHSCLGSLLAAYWLMHPPPAKADGDE